MTNKTFTIRDYNWVIDANRVNDAIAWVSRYEKHIRFWNPESKLLVWVGPSGKLCLSNERHISTPVMNELKTMFTRLATVSRQGSYVFFCEYSSNPGTDSQRDYVVENHKLYQIIPAAVTESRTP